MKFLLIQTAFIGDVILATPLIEKLHRFYPGADIDFLVRKGNESLLLNHPILRKCLVWNKKEGKYRTLRKLLLQIRAERYDYVINCQRFAASGILTAFAGARTTIGFDKNPLSFLFNQCLPHRIDAKSGSQHEVSRNLSLIERLTDTSFEKPKLYPSLENTSEALKLAGPLPYFCIAPTSVWFTKQWPAHKWIELIQQLPPNLTVFLLGAPSDLDACQYIMEHSARQEVRNVAGQLSLLGSAALMKNAQMNFVNDSAPMHLASAVNAPVTAIFCSTIPAFGFTPLSDQSKIVETKQALSCRPCGLHGFVKCPKGHFACAESIEINVHLNQETA